MKSGQDHGMEFQTGISKTYLIEIPLYHFQRRHFLRHKQDFLAITYRFSN